jgi:hypothetical protein
MEAPGRLEQLCMKHGAESRRLALEAVASEHAVALEEEHCLR